MSPCQLAHNTHDWWQGGNTKLYIWAIVNLYSWQLRL